MAEIETIDISDRAKHEALVDRFHAGLYLSEFAAQAEPIDVWKWALFSSEAPYRMRLRLAVQDSEIVGGVAFEHYPRSNCGVVTYVVVSKTTRGGGLGKSLRTGAAVTMYDEGARAVFGEVNDPRQPHSYEPVETTWKRIQTYQRWGSRVCDIKYAQPSLGEGLERDRGLVLVRHAGNKPPLTEMPGAIIRDFIAEFYEVTEDGRAPDDELRGILAGIPDTVRLYELAP